jgi:hypothetical protein
MYQHLSYVKGSHIGQVNRNEAFYLSISGLCLLHLLEMKEYGISRFVKKIGDKLGLFYLQILIIKPFGGTGLKAMHLGQSDPLGSLSTTK